MGQGVIPQFHALDLRHGAKIKAAERHHPRRIRRQRQADDLAMRPQVSDDIAIFQFARLRLVDLRLRGVAPGLRLHEPLLGLTDCRIKLIELAPVGPR